MEYLKNNGIEAVNYRVPIYMMENYNSNDIFIMRDDLIPFSFGGNKARKGYNFFKEILEQKYDYVITYGSASSNHCRIIANLAQKYDIKCTIISTEKESDTFNKEMCNIFKAEYVFCKIEEVKETINEQIEKKEKSGYKPYFIQGGGHGNLGTQAYIDAYKEIVEFENKKQLDFDYIFLASGTGTTQAGLIIGNRLNKKQTKIMGISIARKKPYGREVIINSIKEYTDEKNIEVINKNEDVYFLDDYICGGYGKYNKEIEDTIDEELKTNGVPLDTTYTGKAFWGMKKYIEKENIKNKKILFIHTGGTPIFFDYLGRR